MFRKTGQMDEQLEKTMLLATAVAGAESFKLQTKKMNMYKHQIVLRIRVSTLTLAATT